MDQKHTLIAIGVGTIGTLLTIGLILATSGSARIVTMTAGLALTAYAILLTVYFSQRTAMPVTEPVATPQAEPTPEVAVTISEKPKEAVAYYDFKGDVHEIIDVEGIGPKYADRLVAAGIETTTHLCYESAETIADITGAPIKTVQKWQSMAELAKVNGIGKQYAEALVRAGIDGIDTLKRRDATKIAEQVTAYLAGLDNHVLGQKVTARRVAGWQDKAKTMRRVRQAIPA